MVKPITDFTGVGRAGEHPYVVIQDLASEISKRLVG